VAALTGGAGAPAVLAASIGGFTAGTVSVAGKAGVNPLSALLGGAALGAIEGGALGGGIFGGYGFPIGGAATTPVGVLAADIANGTVRGFVVGTISSAISGTKFSNC